MNIVSPQLDIAVVGSGIAGLSCAWLLSKRHRVTVYEAAERPGGHSNTIAVQTESGRIAIDTGFIVYNEATYPNLTALFAYLGLETNASVMSFSVSRDKGGFEYAGGSLRGLFAQPGNVLRPRLWSMLRDIARFYREAPRELATLAAEVSLGAYLNRRGYGRAFREDHLLPMAAAIWSTPIGAIEAYPAAAFIRFCLNHGLMQFTRRPVWRTVRGGASRYVERLVAELTGPLHLGRQIVRVIRDERSVRLVDIAGQVARHDHVVIATHAHQALAMLDPPTRPERALLGTFGSSRNLAVLHRDASLMPCRRPAWSSWNIIEEGLSGAGKPFISYWMNRLQAIPGATEYFVTLNPPRPPRPGTMIHSEQYDHPLFNASTLAAQRRLWMLQGRQRTWFCGAWFGAGFHEDGLQAGLAVAEALGGVLRPWTVAEPSGRIHVGDEYPGTPVAPAPG